MTNQKHTPGPWFVQEQPINGKYVDIEVSYATEDDWIFSICEVAQYRDSGSPRCREDRANAHLIAAAPELLAMVKAMNYAFYADGTKKALLEVMKESKALIAKAEGRGE